MHKFLTLLAVLMLTGCAQYSEQMAPCDAYRGTCYDLQPINVSVD